jgi:hypothetical protein
MVLSFGRILVPVEERRESFIGSMRGTMEILGAIVSPIDVKWIEEVLSKPDVSVAPLDDGNRD